MKLSQLSKALVFKKLKDKIDIAIKLEISHMGEKTKLRDAVEFSLLNGGKRFRPIIVLLIAQSLDKDFDATKAALACEFFHTASLIADDLPCMDDEKTRRSKPALHLEFDEATAILASYALISSGYELIYKNAKELNNKTSKAACDNICALSIETVSKYAGIKGATGGQFLDLYSKDVSHKNICEIILKKTISLFEISFVLGWLFGGGDLKDLDLVRATSYHFGMVFQIADDLKDFEEDDKKNKKINMAISLGKIKAKQLCRDHLEKLTSSLQDLKILSKSFEFIISLLKERI